LSGHMICQYTANSLAHKISLLAQPGSTINITSANESEDVVSYGATCAQKLLDQLQHFEELLAIHLVTVAQAYSLARKTQEEKNPLCEAIFAKIAERISLPCMADDSFEARYAIAQEILNANILG